MDVVTKMSPGNARADRMMRDAYDRMNVRVREDLQETYNFAYRHAPEIAVGVGAVFTAGAIVVDAALPGPGGETKVAAAGVREGLEHADDLVRAASNGSDVLYHYTDAPASSFKNGLWSGSSVTDNPNLTATEAVEMLGVKRPPDKIIPIKASNFRPNRPFIVEPHPLGPGGGTDFTNVAKVPAEDILPAIPVRQ